MTRLEQLYRLHHGSVFGLCLRILRDRNDAEDAAQEVFLNAWRAADRLRPDSNPRAWLSAIATNVSLKHLRSRRRREKDLDAAVDDCVGESGQATESRAQLEYVLAKIGPRSALIVVAHLLLGASQDEVAQRFGLSRRAVVKRLSNARRTARSVAHAAIART
ncbi:MAG TPA: sigma-70 family RNA polymerase sigma factor [Polyangiales bacterium]|nr:sigma-70 family RNA polymerase sigma factor [Polyangiales bacterium]